MCDHPERGWRLLTSGPTLEGFAYSCPGCGISGSGATAQEAHEAWKNRAVREAAIARWKRGEEPKDDTERRVLALSVFAPSCDHRSH